jgi:UDP-N-acetylmuramate-alanine ligase
VSLQTVLPGSYNFVNLCQGVALVRELCGQIRGTVPEFEDIAQWVGQFEGVKRRFEVLFKRSGGLHVYEDFAHHPTAVAHVIRTFKSMEPTKKLIVAFEPRNATSRRALFMDEYVQALGGADVVLLGALPVDTRIPTSERMDTYALARRIGPKAHAFATNAELEQWLKSQKHYQSAVMFMSSGDFSGIQHRLVAWLKHQVTWTPCEVPERAKNA